jgi:2-oxoglutarate dehydrogenase complex dehydrogenase (E1) component-like enzyme
MRQRTFRVYLLVQGYRSLGQYPSYAQIQFFLIKKKENPSLALSQFGLFDADMDKEVSTFGVLPVKIAKLSTGGPRAKENISWPYGCQIIHPI